MKAKINEIFSSIQGEGPVVGYKQLFIRFCGCNLKCSYCDTEFIKGEEFTPGELYDKITKEYDLKSFHSVSLTGGEPLLHAGFLKEFLPLIKNQTKIYLETNATLADKFLEIKQYVDIVAADIKLESATGIKDTYKFHDKFFEACRGVETFAKIVFNEKITDEEIEKCCELGKKYNLELILQPEMHVDILDNSGSCLTNMTDTEFCVKTLDKFLEKYENVRLIPQVHKFLEVR